jgi:hypothetical protein
MLERRNAVLAARHRLAVNDAGSRAQPSERLSAVIPLRRTRG